MITEPRHFYKPFEYQIAFDFFKDQHRVHWLADEVPLSSDLNDWKLKLSESESNGGSKIIAYELWMDDGFGTQFQ